MPVAVITGANRGLGLEFARQYLQLGWRVIALSRRTSDALDALAQGDALTILSPDLTNDQSLSDAVAEIDDERIDLLINNAGTMGDQSFADVGFGHQVFGSFDRAEWRRVFDINVCTPMALSELLVDKLALAERGIIVTISSMLGSNALNTMGNSYAYRASKAAVNAIMTSMGRNLAERGIVAIALHPGWVRTELSGDDAELDPADAVAGCIEVIGRLTLKDAGRFVAWNGNDMPY